MLFACSVQVGFSDLLLLSNNMSSLDSDFASPNESHFNGIDLGTVMVIRHNLCSVNCAIHVPNE